MKLYTENNQLVEIDVSNGPIHFGNEGDYYSYKNKIAKLLHNCEDSGYYKIAKAMYDLKSQLNSIVPPEDLLFSEWGEYQGFLRKNYSSINLQNLQSKELSVLLGELGKLKKDLALLSKNRIVAYDCPYELNILLTRNYLLKFIDFERYYFTETQNEAKEVNNVIFNEITTNLLEINVCIHSTQMQTDFYKFLKNTDENELVRDARMRLSREFSL